jgi:iron complex transport system substrate-binding protein
LALLMLLAHPAGAFEVTDDTGARITLAAPAARIASLAPGATEMLFAAGAGAQVVATVAYSDDPTAAQHVPRIGDANAIDLERLAGLHPDVIVVWPGGGNPAQMQHLARMGIPIYRQQVDRLAELPDSLRRLGALTGTSAAAERSATALQEQLQTLKARYAGARAVTVLLEVWDRPLYTVGGTQFMSDALALCGARNIFGDLRDRGPAIEVESVLARDPEVIIAAAPVGAAAGWLDEWRRFKSLRAVRTGRLIPFEDRRFSSPAPGAIAATADLCGLIDAARRR